MTTTKIKNGSSQLASQLPMDRLMHEVEGLGQALTAKGLSVASQRVGSLTDRLNQFAAGQGTAAAKKAVGGVAEKAAGGTLGSKMGGKLKETLSSTEVLKPSNLAKVAKVGSVASKLPGVGGGDDKSPKLKVTNIIEEIDVPVPREVAYQQWTRFEDFPDFMKKVENVTQEEDEKLTWQAKIMWSHRRWQAHIEDQVPNERIVWTSEGEKGHVDGAVTFHELAPDLTRILVVLEYHPKGLFEHTGNIWRAQGRRVRAELKHFVRHVSTHTLLDQDSTEGWEGEIHEGEVTDSASDESASQDG